MGRKTRKVIALILLMCVFFQGTNSVANASDVTEDKKDVFEFHLLWGEHTEKLEEIESGKIEYEAKEKTDYKISVEASDGQGEYQYQLAVKKEEMEEESEAEILQEYSSDNILNIGELPAGVHTYYVTIKTEDNEVLSEEIVFAIPEEKEKESDQTAITDSADDEIAETEDAVVFSTGNSRMSGKLWSNKTTSEYVNRSVVLTADVENGDGNYTYQFVEVYDSKTTVLQDGSSNVYRFTTNKIGTHQYYVNITDGTGQKLQLSYTMTVVLHPDYKLYGTLKSSRTKAEYVNRSVTLSADASKGYGGYEYQFIETYGSTTKVVQAYSSSNKYSFTTTEIGNHKYYVDIRDKSGQSVRLNYEMTVVLHPDYKISGKVQSSKTVNEYENRSVTLTASVSKGYGDYQYRFTEVFASNSKVLRDYSAANTYSFVTSGVGKHTYYIDVKDKSGQTLRLSYTMTVVKEPVKDLKGNLTSSKSIAEYENRAVKLTANVTQGNGGYQYRFTEVYGAITKTLQDYSTKNTYSFSTRDVGKHIYYVDIKDQKGKTLRLSYTMTVVKEPAYTIKGTLTSSKTPMEYENRVVRLTANVSQGNGDYKYCFTEIYGATTKVVQDYSSINTYGFTTKGTGKHIYYVDIKDKKGETLRLSYTMTVVQEPEKDLKGTLTSNKTITEYVSRSVKLTANVTQGNGPYQYQFSEVYDGDTKVVQAFGTKNTYSFTTKEVGVHTYYADIKDQRGKTLRLTYKMTVVAHPDYKLEGTLTSNKSTVEYVNRSVKLTAKVTKEGYGGGYTYQFSEKYEGSTTVLRAYTSDPSYSFSTAKVGTHIYYVTIKDKKGQTYQCSYTMDVKIHPDYVMSAKLTSNKSSAEYSNRSVTLTASVNGGYGGYTYQFTREFNGHSKVMQQYSSKNTYSFLTGLPGKYTYYVDVKDSSGTVVRSSYSITVVSNGTLLSGIDVSAYQGYINWKSVKNSGVDFTMLRILENGMSAMKVDDCFYDNIKNATDNGVKVGVYRYGYAMTVAQAQKEAKMVVDTIKNSGYRISFPVAYDVEDPDTQATLSPQQLTEIINAFKVVIENNGYKFMIYSTPYWLNYKMDMNKFAADDLWVASWRDYDLGHNYSGPGNVTIWQYASDGKVPGISGNVDMDVAYVNY